MPLQVCSVSLMRFGERRAAASGPLVRSTRARWKKIIITIIIMITIIIITTAFIIIFISILKIAFRRPRSLHLLPTP